MRSLALLPLLALSASAQLCATNPSICPANTYCQDRGDGSPSCVGGASPPCAGGVGGAANWGQCGGLGFAGPTCCAGSPDWLCFFANDFHSQCLRVIYPAPAASTTVAPTTAAPTTLATSTTTVAPATSTVARVCTSHWGQCGGQGWNGPTCCQDDATWFCEVANNWFSMCHPRPVSVSSVSSVSSSAVATPSAWRS